MTEYRPTILMFVLAVGSSLTVFLLDGHRGFGLWDEGFLWYGAQRVMLGEVPLRDFMAYDIGRYYWSAAFMSVAGDNGIVALRAAGVVFQALALFIGLTALARGSATQNPVFWLLAVTTLVVWMSPQYRVFDTSLPYILMGALTFLIEKPSRRRYLVIGMVVGLAAVFGRNHGVYGVTASLGAMVYLAVRRKSCPSRTSALAFWAVGVIVGYLPLLLFVAAVPGFGPAFWENIRFQFEVAATNIPLPVPWPWLVPFGQLSTVDMLREVAVGILFVAIIAFGVLGMGWVFREGRQGKPVSPALASSVFLALPYAHYAFSRADIDHLAPGIPPFLLGVLALLANQPGWLKGPAVALLCAQSLLVMLPTHPAWRCHDSQECVEARVGRDRLRINRGTANQLTTLEKLAEEFAPGDQAFIVAPFWPGAYAALGRKSPMWEIFALSPRSPAFQRAEVERIEAARPGFVLINDAPLDGREESRFARTHPIVDQYIRDHFERLDGYMPNPTFRLYRGRLAGR